MKVIELKRELTIKKETLSFIVFSIGVFLAFFDSHIEKITGINRLPLPELYIGGLCVFFIVQNSFFYRKISNTNLYISIATLLACVVGLLKYNTSLPGVFIGVFWLFKPLYAYYAGYNLGINEHHKKRVISLFYYLAIISLIFTFVQVFKRDFNPFGFIQASSGRIGFMDNPNKNGFLLLTGFLFVNIYKSRFHRLMALLFITGIVLVESRQIIITLIVILSYYYFVIKRNYLVLAAIPAFLAIGIIYFQRELFYRFGEIDRIIETGNYFRLKALKIGGEVLYHNPLFGTGPGTFGGFVAHYTESKIHDKYNLFAHWSTYNDPSKIPATIDMFWPHFIVELGLVGSFLALIIFFNIYVNLKGITSKSAILIRLLFLISIFLAFFSMSLEAAYIAIPIFLLIGAQVKENKA